MNSYGGHLQMVHATTEKAVVDRVMSYVHIQDMARRSIHCNGAGRWRGRPRPVNVEAARAYCALRRRCTRPFLWVLAINRYTRGVYLASWHLIGTL